MESPINMHTKGSNFLMGVFAILLVTLIGFYRPYFGKLTTSEAISWVIHLHLIAFLCWFFVLIWQPILIRQKEFKLHRKVGKFTYILVPILVFTILNIVYFQLSFYVPGQSNDSVYINMLGGSLSGLFFITYYLLAIINSKNTRWHIAFIVASSLVLLNPGLSRMVAWMSDRPTGLLAMIITPYIVLLCILLYEKVKLKKHILKSPYALIFLMFGLELFLFATIAGSEFWPAFIDKLAKNYQSIF